MLQNPLVRKLIRLAIDEDLASGDITSALTIPAAHRSSASIIARERLIACGTPLIAMVIKEMASSIESELRVTEGEAVEAGGEITRLSGFTRELLASERLMLNLLQRMSGVASATAEFVARAKGMVVLDTRKTIPGWRWLDKYAVVCGDGRNHRYSMGDMVLIKNNHVDARGGDMRALLNDVKALKPRYMPVEVEVRTRAELEIALASEPTVVMLDNMSNEEIKESLALCAARAPRVQVEVSGGITTERLKELQELGVQAVSVGAITTAARNRDISMTIKKAQA